MYVARSDFAAFATSSANGFSGTPPSACLAQIVDSSSLDGISTSPHFAVFATASIACPAANAVGADDADELAVLQPPRRLPSPSPAPRSTDANFARYFGDRSTRPYSMPGRLISDGY